MGTSRSPRAVVDIQQAGIGLPGGDDLPSVRVEGALMKGALDLLVPPQIAVMCSPMAALYGWLQNSASAGWPTATRGWPGRWPGAVPGPAADCADGPRLDG
jgi:hypothetical protein